MNRPKEIGLIDVDGHKGHPNLALMRLSAWHKANGDLVEWWNGLEHYDRVYMSKVFGDEYTPDVEFAIQADAVIEAARRTVEAEEAKSHPDPSVIKEQQEIIACAELRKEKTYTEKQMLKWYNKLHTDSAEYKMWGNGIALPPALYCMQGIAEVLRGGENG